MATSWARIALLYAIGVLAAGQLGIVPPLIAALQRDLGLSLASAGLAVSIVTLVGAAFGLPAGRWCQAVGHARALGLGVLIMAAAAALAAMAADDITLLAARGLAGIGYLLVVIAAPSLMAAIAEPRHQAFTLSLWGSFVPTGIALAGLATASVGSASWRTVFAVDALLLGLAVVVASRAIPKTVPTRCHDHPVLLQELWPAAPLAVAFFCFALLFLALAGLLPSYLVNQRALADSEAGRIVAIATACGIPGSLAAAWFLRRGMRPRRLVAAGIIISAVLAGLSFTVAPTSLAAIGFSLSFTLGGLVPAAAFAAVPGLAADARAIGPINGLLAQSGSLGSVAGPPLLALWIGWTDWSLAPVLVLAIATFGAAAALSRPVSRPP